MRHGQSSGIGIILHPTREHLFGLTEYCRSTSGLDDTFSVVAPALVDSSSNLSLPVESPAKSFGLTLSWTAGCERLDLDLTKKVLSVRLKR